jgi:hypothetical protein
MLGRFYDLVVHPDDTKGTARDPDADAHKHQEFSPPKPDFASKRPGAHKCPAPSGALLFKRSEVPSSCRPAIERPLCEKVETALTIRTNEIPAQSCVTQIA